MKQKLFRYQSITVLTKRRMRIWCHTGCLCFCGSSDNVQDEEINEIKS